MSWEIAKVIQTFASPKESGTLDEFRYVDDYLNEQEKLEITDNQSILAMAQFLVGSPQVPVIPVVLKFDRLANEMNRSVGKSKISAASMLATETENAGRTIRGQRIDYVSRGADDLFGLGTIADRLVWT